MAKSKTKMPKDLKKKCHAVIHTATAAAAAGGCVPVPVADTIPITAAQVTMIVGLGKVFDISISESVAKSIMSVALAQTAGRAVVGSAFKVIPGLGTVIGGIISAVTAASVTEGLGWLIADDFYRISIGNQPEDLVGVLDQLNTIKNNTLGR